MHKGLRKLYADGATRGVPPDAVDKLRKVLAFLDDMEGPEDWSLSVTANRRLTFRIDTTEGEVYDVNLEDYH